MCTLPFVQYVIIIVQRMTNRHCTAHIKTHEVTPAFNGNDSTCTQLEVHCMINYREDRPEGTWRNLWSCPGRAEWSGWIGPCSSSFVPEHQTWLDTVLGRHVAAMLWKINQQQTITTTIPVTSLARHHQPQTSSLWLAVEQSTVL